MESAFTCKWLDDNNSYTRGKTLTEIKMYQPAWKNYKKANISNLTWYHNRTHYKFEISKGITCTRP